jgi:4a-hydroxytetrahydrobiopterin dehydratase
VTDQPLSRAAASAAVEAAGWRLLYDSLATSVPVRSLREALSVTQAAVDASGPDADDHLRADARPDRVVLILKCRDAEGVTSRDAELAGDVTAALSRLGFEVAPQSGPSRPVQMVSFMIDALDIDAIRPFWKAVLAYEDGPGGALIDPAGQLPMLLFQQMDEPRPQRNRIHIDVDLPHEDAPRRLQAALGAGGVLVNDRFAKAWWVLADAEGNEACICTWQDRD